MMIEEFEKLTGIYPTIELYKAIEAEYMNGNYESKEAFCKAYKGNKNNFMAERIQRKANESAWKTESEMNEKISQLTAERDGNIKALRAQIAVLDAQLEREQEWKDNGINSKMSELEYKQLAENPDTRFLGNDEAVTKIALEFGFDCQRIEICRVTYRTEINRHGAIRRAEALECQPCYNSSDWNYIKFSVGGYTYEMVNGSLHFVYD